MADPLDPWSLFGRLFSGLTRVGGRATVVSVRGLGSALRRGALSSGSGRVSVLTPGDPPLPPGAVQGSVVQDYRGVALAKELHGLRRGVVSLGLYTHPTGRRGPELFLQPEMLFRHCAVLGPVGSGKTVGVVLPWASQLLSVGAAVVVVDVKGDLIDLLAPRAQELGAPVYYWSSSDQRSAAWNFLREVTSERDVEAATLSILGKRPENESQPFFRDRDHRWLRALIQVTSEAFPLDGAGKDLHALVASQERLLQTFRRFPSVRGLQNQLYDLLELDPADYSLAVSGLLNALHVFSTPQVAGVTERHDFSLQQILDGGGLFVIGAPMADGRTSEVLSSLVLNTLFNRIYRRLESPSTGRRPVVFLVDEAARLRDRIKFEEVLAVIRSADAGLVLATQDVTQFGSEREAGSVLSNCLSILTLNGCSADTAEFLGRRLGQRYEASLSESTSRNAFEVFGQVGSSRAVSAVPVLGLSEIMHLQQGPYCAVAYVPHGGSSKPFLVDLCRDTT